MKGRRKKTTFIMDEEKEEYHYKIGPMPVNKSKNVNYYYSVQQNDKEARLNFIYNRATDEGGKLVCKMNKYVSDTLEKDDYLHRDMMCITRDWRKWYYFNSEVNIYIITNNFEDFDTQTHVGAHSKLLSRFKQHNAVIPGGPQGTKRAAGYWNMIFYMKIPPMRNFSCRDIVKQIDISRGLTSRCKKMILFAMSIRAEFRISPLILDKSSVYYSEVVEEMINECYTKEEIEKLMIPGDQLKMRSGRNLNE